MRGKELFHSWVIEGESFVQKSLEVDLDWGKTKSSYVRRELNAQN